MSDLDIIVGRLEDAGATRAYKVGAVPQRPDYPYVVASLDSGLPMHYSTAGETDHLLRRISVQLVGKTWESVMAAGEAADVAFRDKALTEFDGSPVARREFATDVRRDDDAGGLLYGLHTYQF